MENRQLQSAPDYTNAALVMLFINLFWIFVALWAAWGWGPVLLTTALINHLIIRQGLNRRRTAPQLGRAR